MANWAWCTFSFLHARTTMTTTLNAPHTSQWKNKRKKILYEHHPGTHMAMLLWRMLRRNLYAVLFRPRKNKYNRCRLLKRKSGITTKPRAREGARRRPRVMALFSTHTHKHMCLCECMDLVVLSPIVPL